MILFAILIVLTFLYKRMEDKRISEEEYENYHLIQQYLLNDPADLGKKKKPILWIHIPHEYNSRHWQSFGSRSSRDLNQPYLYLTVKSIIDHCQDSFYICLIDDDSFTRLIPDWEIDMTSISKPVTCKIRSLAMAKLIYIYGGISLPISFLCMRDLHPLFETSIEGGGMFVCENVDRNVTSSQYKFYPDIHFFGAPRKNETVLELIHFMENLISTDFTAESQFLGEVDQWCQKNSRVHLVCGRLVGVKNMEYRSIGVEDLLGQTPIDLDPDAYGIWIPGRDIEKRTQYEWFLRLSPQQIVSGDTMLSKYFALVEAGAGKENFGIRHKRKRPLWVSFWKVASGAPLWGMRPLGQGDTSVLPLAYPDN